MVLNFMESNVLGVFCLGEMKFCLQHILVMHELSAAICSYLELSGAICSYLELSGGIWSYLELSGAVWSYLELPGETFKFILFGAPG